MFAVAIQTVQTSVHFGNDWRTCRDSRYNYLLTRADVFSVISWLFRVPARKKTKEILRRRWMNKYEIYMR